jgi:thiosulfate reductase cytochrome b subunit
MTHYAAIRNIMEFMENGILNRIEPPHSMADAGILYSTNEYDQERYMSLKGLSLGMKNKVTDHSIQVLKESFPHTTYNPQQNLMWWLVLFLL